MPTETPTSFEALLSLGLYTAIAVGLVGLLMLLSWGISPMVNRMNGLRMMR